MKRFDFHDGYDSKRINIRDLFGAPSVGFFVPVYQREYTWESDNINQLFDDLVFGVADLTKEVGSNNESNNAATFLGTTITTTLTDQAQAIMEGHQRFQLASVEIVIDGQQRISTLALLAIQIVEKIKKYQGRLPDSKLSDDLKNHCTSLIKTLKGFYSAEPRFAGATPSTKPKIIRARDDHWVYESTSDNSYKTPIARYIAAYIRSGSSQRAIEELDATEKGKRVPGNIKLINELLDGICDAYKPNTPFHNQFPAGGKIVADEMQEFILGFQVKGLADIVGKRGAGENSDDCATTSLYHIFLFVYYLLERCGVNYLQPKQESWGFDMFQALNTTGTPLTAMETFLPEVIQTEPGKWEESESFKCMEEIDALFQNADSNEKKSHRTNELLAAFTLCYNGDACGNKFSAQSSWLKYHYGRQLNSNLKEKQDFLRKLAQIATFFYAVWHMEDDYIPHRIELLKDLDDEEEGKKVAPFLVQYLKDANSKLSAPIMGRFYSQAREDERKESAIEFVKAAKACAAFFTLWRSAKSTAGLDDIYRKFWRKRKSTDPSDVSAQNWMMHPGPVTSRDLRRYFRDVLKRSGLESKEQWKSESKRFLLYTEVQKVCRFVLFIAGHDRVEDSKQPGLVKEGTPGTCSLWNLETWRGRDHKTLEHIAPQRPPDGHKWDKKIYAPDGNVHEIGNLLLLPMAINSAASNKEWAVKFLHYSHVGKSGRDEIRELRAQAEAEGVVLNKRAIKEFRRVKYNRAVTPILTLGKQRKWDAKMINGRTDQIKEIVWETLMSWLHD